MQTFGNEEFPGALHARLLLARTGKAIALGTPVCGRHGVGLPPGLGRPGRTRARFCLVACKSPGCPLEAGLATLKPQNIKANSDLDLVVALWLPRGFCLCLWHLRKRF